MTYQLTEYHSDSHGGGGQGRRKGGIISSIPDVETETEFISAAPVILLHMSVSGFQTS